MREVVLLVDDDPILRDFMVGGLTDAGFQVLAFADGKSAIESVKTVRFDLAIIDLILPDLNGLELVKRIRELPDIGVIIVSGQDDITDRIVGLEVGADDYLTKPFELRELTARVSSVLRRVKTLKRGPLMPADGEKPQYAFDGWRLDPLSYRVDRPDGQELQLTTGEFQLLEFLVTHPDRVWEARRLSELLPGDQPREANASIASRIKRLRQKMGEDFRNPKLIRTVRGSGYKFIPRVERMPRAGA